MFENGDKKRILCYGDSNTWGWVPSSMGNKRFGENTRWTMLLQKKLGDKYKIIEEGLGARTTKFDDPRPELSFRNGLLTLPFILESHQPLDLVILMLGTTDTKEMMNLAPFEIADGIKELITVIKNSKSLEGFTSPRILIIVPPVVKEEAEFASKLFKGGSEKGLALVDLYKKFEEEGNVFYLNPLDSIEVDTDEGVHLDAENHMKLSEIIYKKVKEIL